MAGALAAAGGAVTVLDPARAQLDPPVFDVVVGDELAHRDLAGVFARIPLPRVLVVHHLAAWEEHPPLRRVALLATELSCLHRADLVITPSPYVAHRLARLGVRAEIVLPGADRLPRRPRAAPVDAVRLLAVGSIVPRKRLGLVLDALDRVADPGVFLDVIGEARDRPYAEAIRARIARSPHLARTVRLCGAVDEAALADAYRAASAIVLASSLEGYGMVLTEALHAGVPVLAARTSSIPEVVADGREAILFDEASVDAVIRAFAGAPEIRLAMGRAAEARFSSLPRWAASEARFIDLLRRTRRS
jgi:glycosyltransferase involved in cell wall biosynthesis